MHTHLIKAGISAWRLSTFPTQTHTHIKKCQRSFNRSTTI
jgi:hypothetical protein